MAPERFVILETPSTLKMMGPFEVYDEALQKPAGWAGTYEEAELLRDRWERYVPIDPRIISPSLAVFRSAKELNHFCANNFLSLVGEREAFRMTPKELNDAWWEENRPDEYIKIRHWNESDDGSVWWRTTSGRLLISATETSVTLTTYAGHAPSISDVYEWEEEWGECLIPRPISNVALRVRYDFRNDGLTASVLEVNPLLLHCRRDRARHIIELDLKVFGGALSSTADPVVGELFKAYKECRERGIYFT